MIDLEQDVGVVLFAHGSSDPRWRLPFEKMLESLRRRIFPTPCELAFLEGSFPNFDNACEYLQMKGAKRIRVIPAFMSSGGHVANDLPKIIERAQTKFPSLRFSLSEAVGESSRVQEAIVSATIEAASDREI